MKSNFKERLRELRTAKEMSVEKLAEIIGVSGASVSCWENGINDIKSEYLIRLAKFFGVTTDYLLGLEN